MVQAAEGNVQPVWEDLFHGLVRKCVLTPGAGSEIPSNAEVRLAISMYVVSDLSGFNPKAMKQRLLYQHTVTEPLVKSLSAIMPIGLQRAVSTMCTGEKAKIWIDSVMAYGSVGLVFGDEPSESISPNAALLFDVHVVNWQVNELRLCAARSGGLRFTAMPLIDEQLIQAEKDVMERREKAGLRSLCRAISQLEHMRISNEKEEKKRKSTVLAASVLASECALALGRYPLAVTFGRRVLEITPLNPDANYIVGRAYFALGYNRSARYFAQKAWCCDVENDRYKMTLDEICKHMALIDDGDSDGDDETDTADYELLAEVIMEKRKQPEVVRALKKDLARLINASVHKRQIDIQGGFSPAFLEDVEEGLRKKNQYLLVSRTSPVSLEVRIL